MEKQQQNLAVVNYRSSAATLPKKRQSNSSSGRVFTQNSMQQHSQQQYYSQASHHSSASHQHLGLQHHQNNNVTLKTHRSNKDSLSSIAKEHHSMIGGQLEHQMSQHVVHTGSNLMVNRPPPSARNSNSQHGKIGGNSTRKSNTLQKAIGGLSQQQKALHQNLKATVKSPRLLLATNPSAANHIVRRSKDFSNGTMLSQERSNNTKGLLSPKRVPQPPVNGTKFLKKAAARNNCRSNSKSSSSGKHTTQGAKLTKATSQKTLLRVNAGQKSTGKLGGRTSVTAKKPTPLNQRCETTGSETMQLTTDTQTCIQPPISSSTMINASRRKFISTPRNGKSAQCNNVVLAQTFLPTKSSLIQRNLSNKILSPVNTASRKNKQTVTVMSPSGSHDLGMRPKSHIKTFSLPKNNATGTTHCHINQMQQLTQSSGGKLSMAHTLGALIGNSINHHPHHQSASNSKLETLSITSSQKQTMSSKNCANVVLQHSGNQQHQHSKINHQYTPSLQSAQTVIGQQYSNQGYGSNGSGLHHKTQSLSTNTDKVLNKLHLSERPKTTMLVQLQQSNQQTQSAVKPFHRQHQSTAMATNHRVLSPSKITSHQLLTQSSSDNLHPNTKTGVKQATTIPSNNHNSRLGVQNQRSSGDFTLQTYRHTSQSSQGFISSVSKSHQHNMMLEQTSTANTAANNQNNRALQRESSKKAFTKERFSTTTLKTYKSGKTAITKQNGQFSSSGGNQCRATSSIADSLTNNGQQIQPNINNHSSNQKSGNVFNNCRKGSQITSQSNQRLQTALSEIDDLSISSRSAKTHIIDEVLHQQKTEAYRDLQKHPNNQYGMIVETSSMGQIIEQEDEFHDLSVDKEEVAHELETQGAELAYPQIGSVYQSSQKMSTVISQSASTTALALGSKQPKQPQQADILIMTNHNPPSSAGGVAQTLRMLTNRAKTTINLNDLRQMHGDNSSTGAGGTAFSIRKKSNDTVLQATCSGQDLLLPRKSSLAMLLVNKPMKKGDGNGGSQLLQHVDSISEEEDKIQQSKNKSTIMVPQGLISESLVNSYLTGNGSIAGQSHKWMCSSKSAKNMMTSCSLGPKSELKQTEQANAENPIKILHSEVASAMIKEYGSASKQESIKMINTKTTGEKPKKAVPDAPTNNNDKNQSDQQQLDTDQQGLNTTSLQNYEETKIISNVPFGPKQSKIEGDGAILKPGKQVTDSSLMKPIQESFKSTLVDYTESMNENQITRLTLEQSREMLVQACKNGDLYTVRRLAQVEHRTSFVNFDDLVNNTDSNVHLQSQITQGNTPLHYACISGHVDIAELLIRKMNARVDSTNDQGETPLHLACSHGHKGVIERLLLARASTNIRDTFVGNTPLHVLALTGHQRNQNTTSMHTGTSDTIRQTMDSVNQAECLITEDFAAPQQNPRSSLIELILPFAEESKSIANNEGILPWQLAQSEMIASLLQPSRTSTRSRPVTASQIQGQGNQDGRNSVITRNHSQANNLHLINNEPMIQHNAINSIEVKNVCEDEIANIFTFYKASRTDEAQTTNLNANEKQFTFQATQPSATMEQIIGGVNGGEVTSEKYQTSSSLETLSGQKRLSSNNHGDHQMQRIKEEEEKINIQNFLDDDIDQIDNILRKAAYNNSHIATGDHHVDQYGGGVSNEYSSSYKSKNVINDRQVTKKRKTEQNMSSGSANKSKGLSSQFLYQMQESSSKQNVVREDSKNLQSQRRVDHQQQFTTDKQRQEDRQDTPALPREPRRKSQLSNVVSNPQHYPTKIVTNYQPSKTLFPQRQQLSTTFDKQGTSSKIGSSQYQQSPQKKIILKAASKHTSKTAVSNQTMDSAKSGNAAHNSNSSKIKSGQVAINTSNRQMTKVRTVQNLRPQTSTQQIIQNRSTARLKLTDIAQQLEVTHGNTPKATNTTPTHSKTVKSGNNQQPARANGAAILPTTTLQKTHSSKNTTTLRTTNSALDLKQKVDKQAGLLMQRSSSKQLLDNNKIRIGPEHFIAHQLLGTGSFGEVFLVERKQDKKLLAMKVLSKKKIKRDNLKKYAITERNVMCSMGEHPFIVQLRYAFQTKDHLFLISDYCPGGDLSQYLEIEECFSEDKARLYIQEILLGIEALHKQNIIFRDLKPDNVIIDKKGHAMLTDFGLSRENVRRPTTGAKSFCGSYAYLAPEMLDKKGHGKAVDWYLLGVILFEMVTGLPPYYADDKDQLFKNIMRDTIDMEEIQTKQQLSNECIDLMQKLLRKDPAARIGTVKGAIEIRQHPFFRQTDWDIVLTKTVPMPEPYLANMAMDIIISQPYLVAGHPHTTGDICPRQHRTYLPGWSFTQANQVGLTESQVSSSEKLNLDAVAQISNQRNTDNQDLVVMEEGHGDHEEGAT